MKQSLVQPWWKRLLPAERAMLRLGLFLRLAEMRVTLGWRLQGNVFFLVEHGRDRSIRSMLHVFNHNGCRQWIYPMFGRYGRFGGVRCEPTSASGKLLKVNCYPGTLVHGMEWCNVQFLTRS